MLLLTSSRNASIPPSSAEALEKVFVNLEQALLAHCVELEFEFNFSGQFFTVVFIRKLKLQGEVITALFPITPSSKPGIIRSEPRTRFCPAALPP